jgi:hypothetical protein
VALLNRSTAERNILMMLNDDQSEGLDELMVEQGLTPSNEGYAIVVELEIIDSPQNLNPIVEVASFQQQKAVPHHLLRDPHRIDPMTGCGRHMPIRSLHSRFDL